MRQMIGAILAMTLAVGLVAAPGPRTKTDPTNAPARKSVKKTAKHHSKRLHKKTTAAFLK
jgi:hypothetical protein